MHTLLILESIRLFSIMMNVDIPARYGQGNPHRESDFDWNHFSFSTSFHHVSKLALHAFKSAACERFFKNFHWFHLNGVQNQIESWDILFNYFHVCCIQFHFQI